MNPIARTPSETRDYLRRVLEMNPLEASEKIVRSRANFLGFETSIDPEGQETHEDLQGRRENAIRDLKTVRQRFWNLKTSHLQTILDELDVESFPDLSHAVDRLNVLVQHRSRLLGFDKHKRCDADFYSCLKKILVRSSRDTAALRDKTILGRAMTAAASGSVFTLELNIQTTLVLST